MHFDSAVFRIHKIGHFFSVCYLHCNILHNINIDKLNFRYSAEMPMVLIQAVIYLGVIAVTRLAKPNIPKLCYRRSEKSVSFIQASLKLVALWSIFAAYIMPFFLVPSTLHPLLAWPLYFLGTVSLSCVAINSFFLPMLPVLSPLLLIFGSLLVMAFPWYSNGVVRALAVFLYAFCASPVAWVSLTKIMSGLQFSLEREVFFPRLGESVPPSGFNKLYWVKLVLLLRMARLDERLCWARS